nr:phosphatase PAP2 family protein [Halomarina salina]
MRDVFSGGDELLLALLTQLGDVWFLLTVAGTFYVVSAGRGTQTHRRRGAFVLALPLVYLVLVTAMKGAFELPRPPDAGVAPPIPWLPSLVVPVYENTATATGYGFPSGHAIGTTLVWGGLGLVADRWSRRLRAGVVASVVTLVCLSRLALGVHYLVDVVAGVAIGVTTLLALYYLSDLGREPDRVFFVAVVGGVVAVVTSWTFDSVLVLGGIVGVWLGWYAFVDSSLTLSVSRRAVALSAAVFVGTLLVYGALYLWNLPVPVMFGASVLAAALVVGVPDIGERVARRLDAT